MPTMIPCSSCACHVRDDDPTCPHCGASLSTAGGPALRPAAAALLGLSLVAGGCWPVAQNKYGTSTTDDIEETAETGDTGTETTEPGS